MIYVARLTKPLWDKFKGQFLSRYYLFAISLWSMVFSQLVMWLSLSDVLVTFRWCPEDMQSILSDTHLFITVIRIHDQRQCGFIWLGLHIPVHHGRKAGQDEDRNWSEGHGGVLFSGFLLMAWSVCFLVHLRTTCPEEAPSYSNHKSRQGPTDVSTVIMIVMFSPLRFVFLEMSKLVSRW